MDWKDLSVSSKNVLERCWSIHHDKPCSFTATIGKPVYGTTITEETYQEILHYRSHFPYFDVKRNGDQLFVSGNCDYGS